VEFAEGFPNLGELGESLVAFLALVALRHGEIDMASGLEG
jgi:hypothetical protein